MPHPKYGKINWISRSIGFQDPELHAESFEKNSLKKIKYSRSSPDPENCQCGHQQPYNLLYLLIYYNYCNWGRFFSQ